MNFYRYVINFKLRTSVINRCSTCRKPQNFIINYDLKNHDFSSSVSSFNELDKSKIRFYSVISAAHQYNHLKNLFIPSPFKTFTASSSTITTATTGRRSLLKNVVVYKPVISESEVKKIGSEIIKSSKSTTSYTLDSTKNGVSETPSTINAEIKKPHRSKRAQLNASEKEKDFLESIQQLQATKNRLHLLGISKNLLTPLETEFGVKTPTQQQKNFVPFILKGKDLLLKDQTGSGKTLGILMALLTKFDTQYNKNSIRKLGKQDRNHTTTKVLMVVPSNALVLQIENWMKRLTSVSLLKDQNGTNEDIELFKCITAMENFENQVEYFKSKNENKNCPWIIVGTPDRLFKLYQEKVLVLDHIETIVLDEVDRMIDDEDSRAPIKRKFFKKIHKPPTELMLTDVMQNLKKRAKELEDSEEMLFASSSIINRGSFKKKSQRKTKELMNGKPQFICSSASFTMHLQLKLIDELKWLAEDSLFDLAGSQLVPSGVTHHCLFLENDGKFRDITLNNFDPLYKQKKELKKLSKEKENRLSSSSSQANNKKEYSQVDNDLDLCVEVIAELADALNVKKGLVFCHSSMSLSKVAAEICVYGVKASSLWRSLSVTDNTSNRKELVQMDEEGEDSMNSSTENLSYEVGQSSSRDTLSPFSDVLFKENRLLCIDEFTARGLDLSDCDTVFLLGKPNTTSSYQHMCGRTGRFGEKGRMITVLPSNRFESKMVFILKALKVSPKPLLSEEKTA